MKLHYSNKGFGYLYMHCSYDMIFEILNNAATYKNIAISLLILLSIRPASGHSAVLLFVKLKVYWN